MSPQKMRNSSLGDPVGPTYIFLRFVAARRLEARLDAKKEVLSTSFERR